MVEAVRLVVMAFEALVGMALKAETLVGMTLKPVIVPAIPGVGRKNAYEQERCRGKDETPNLLHVADLLSAPPEALGLVYLVY